MRFIPALGPPDLAFLVMKGKLIDVPRRTLAGFLALLTLAGVIMLTAMGQSTMQPLSASAPGREFSAERALRHLERFAAEPRPLGSPAGDRARTYLAGQLRAAGLDVEVQRAIGANSSSGLASFGQVDNVVATRRGTDATGTLLIAAHYDSAAVGPGASDDGAAVAAMLETVRALGAAPLRNDLVLLMTDGEEDGVLGAEAFVRDTLRVPGIALRLPGAGPVRLTAIAETDGLSAVPGFTPRPPGLVASTREDGDLIAVTRTYDLRPA